MPTQKFGKMAADRAFAVESNRWTPAQDLEDALIYRGVIVAAWAQVDGLLSDFLFRCGKLADYRELLGDGIPDNRKQRIEKLRQILEVPGPIGLVAAIIRRLLNEAEGGDAIRHVMAHAKMSVLPNWGAEFRGWGRARGRLTKREVTRFPPHELEAEAMRWAKFSTRVGKLYERGARSIDLPVIMEPVQLPAWFDVSDVETD